MKQVVCYYCDLLLSTKFLVTGESASCPRCGEVIYYEVQHLDTALALLISGLIIYFPGILLPFLSMDISGNVQNVSLLGSIIIVLKHGNYLLAIAVFLLIIVAPVVRLLGLLILLLPFHSNFPKIVSRETAAIIAHIAIWNMVEVYLIGVIVTIVKLQSMADLKISIGFFAFCLFIVINALINISLPNKKLWQIVTSN